MLLSSDHPPLAAVSQSEKPASLSACPPVSRGPKPASLFDLSIRVTFHPRQAFFPTHRKHPATLWPGHWPRFFHPNGSRKRVPRERYGLHFWEPGYRLEEFEMKKLSRPDDAQKVPVIPNDDWLIANCPLLIDYLTNVKYDDGSVRELSTLNIFIQDGLFKVAVNDRDAEASLYASGETLQLALAAAESRLNANVPDWRFWKSKTGKKK